MATVTLCDGCDEREDDTGPLNDCAGDCFGEFCDACLDKSGFCEECAEERARKLADVPADAIDTLLNPTPIQDFSFERVLAS